MTESLPIPATSIQIHPGVNGLISRKGGVLIEAVSTHLDICKLSPLGWLSGGFAYVSSDPSPSHTHYTWGSSPTCSCCWSSRSEPRLMPFPFSPEIWPSEWMMLCWDVFLTKSFPQLLLPNAILLLCISWSPWWWDHSHDAMITWPQFIFYVNLLIPTLIILSQIHFPPEISGGLNLKLLIADTIKTLPWSFPTQFSSSATSADSPARTQQEESTCFSNLDFLPCRPIIESWLIYLCLFPYLPTHKAFMQKVF